MWTYVRALLERPQPKRPPRVVSAVAVLEVDLGGGVSFVLPGQDLTVRVPWRISGGGRSAIMLPLTVTGELVLSMHWDGSRLTLLPFPLEEPVSAPLPESPAVIDGIETAPESGCFDPEPQP